MSFSGMCSRARRSTASRLRRNRPWKPGARAITDTPPILIVDGVWGQVLCPTGATWTDQSGHERREMRGVDQVILTVMGVWPDGRHQIIHLKCKFFLRKPVFFA